MDIVSLEDARRQLRLGPDTSRDGELRGWIADALGWIEDYTGHTLALRNVTQTFAGFGVMALRAWPVAPSAVPIVTYADQAGQDIAVPAARIDVSRRPARAVPGIGTRWPSVAAGTTVTVTVAAGYASADAVPRNFHRAALLLIGAYDADREGGEIMAEAEKRARGLCGNKRARSL
ncbi:phage gp6-like head-tail connector protein [Sphingomonas paucimobilis]|uniref:phage gp6-like head-tail connector protein n=1 Tax=Sphingomonas paucimobilis TaxID=13689 RepID=UPI000DE229B6|nr:phage gp6-like head-tail connector protein [Sphingomonas paucimobilis]QBE91910.1 phage gp6-like head-tail connector protein [Sphingomonas paucimobilis]